MSLRRTVEIPKTEQVEFIRHAQIAEVRPETTPGYVLFRLRDEPGRLTHKTRCLVSEDSAGDRMRGEPLVCERSVSDLCGEATIFAGRVGTEIAGDWLWVEVPRAQESLQDLMRRQFSPGGIAPFTLGDIVGVGGGRRP